MKNIKLNFLFIQYLIKNKLIYLKECYQKFNLDRISHKWKNSPIESYENQELVNFAPIPENNENFIAIESYVKKIGCENEYFESNYKQEQLKIIIKDEKINT